MKLWFVDIENGFLCFKGTNKARNYRGLANALYVAFCIFIAVFLFALFFFLGSPK